MSEARLRTVAQVDGEALHRFLESSFGPAKAAFLDRHGDWWHRGQENRMVLEVDGEIAGYNALIPTRCRIGDRTVEAVWWMDLVIAPRFRGRRLQSLLDEEVRRRAPLLLGFPNTLAARIHERHGWGVRDDLRALLLPLDPRELRAVREATGVRGRLLRTAATALAPVAASWRRRLTSLGGGGAWRAESPGAGELASVARRGPAGAVTAIREAADLRWRYLDCPYRRELGFYLAGERSSPRLALILRHLPCGRVRLLDLFGDLEDSAALDDLLQLAISDSARRGATQVVALSTQRPLTGLLRRRGFVLGSRARFCWWSEDGAIMEAIARGPIHWGLGDSDNDEPR